MTNNISRIALASGSSTQGKPRNLDRKHGDDGHQVVGHPERDTSEATSVFKRPSVTSAERD